MPRGMMTEGVNDLVASIEALRTERIKEQIHIPRHIVIEGWGCREPRFEEFAWKFPNGDVKHFDDCTKEELILVLQELCLKIKDEVPS